MAFKAKKPINKLDPFITSGAPLKDHTNYQNQKPTPGKKKGSKKNPGK